MNVVLVYNPKSGGQFELRNLKKIFHRFGVTIDAAFGVTQLGSKDLAKYIRSGAILAVVGGDGTLNAVTQLIAGTKATLFPLPGGTFNHFVRDLGMVDNVESILGGIERAKTVKIDVASVNDQLFLNNSNIGMYPFSLLERKQTKRILGKWLAALWSAIDQLIEFRLHSLVINGEHVKTPFVFVGNNAYDLETVGMPVKKSLTGGKLFVVISKTTSRLTLLKAVLMAVVGKVREHEAIEIKEMTDLEITSRHSKLVVSYDGEASKMSTPLHYRIRPKYLRVMYVPKSEV